MPLPPPPFLQAQSCPKRVLLRRCHFLGPRLSSRSVCWEPSCFLYNSAEDMWRAYSDMREANYKNSDKYFHARGNYDAAQRGPGGKWAAEVISDAREGWQSDVSGRGDEDTRQDQEANAWGRSGGDPNRYRPEGLPSKY
ncbi:serum amyloid A-5 protein-like isoform X3 [Lepidochelys kempii]|uniref:serum amyloid A-5 protein-like isoform X3 n=2 Tax=Lepidochelys kempii TaxID=8472 RepID=UPI003C6FDF60